MIFEKFSSHPILNATTLNDILEAIDGKKCVLLVLLDLPAAFDIIDHNILLSRLSTALKWFVSYLSDCIEDVTIDEVESDLHHLIYGVPLGSVLGPILFILNT